jgi:hypothetical protein
VVLCRQNVVGDLAPPPPTKAPSRSEPLRCPTRALARTTVLDDLAILQGTIAAAIDTGVSQYCATTGISKPGTAAHASLM